ncbi:MAG: CRTAC1 family protein, partial [Deltaproteobacteria bacterium]
VAVRIAAPGATGQGLSYVRRDALLAGHDLSGAVGGIAADLDDDGWMDLVITRWAAPNRILRNLGGAGFEDVTPPAMEAAAWRTQSASAGDLDGDGDLDLFFGSYAVDPDDALFPELAPAEPAELYRNDGGGAWTDLSDRLPQTVHDGYTFASGLYDLDGDGLLDVVVSNDYGRFRPSVVAVNRGQMVFDEDLTWHPGFQDMGLGVGDLNGDLVPDFLITSWRAIALVLSGEAAGAPGVWTDAAAAAGIAIDDGPPLERDFGWGAELGDLDNDGDLDAIAVFGDWDGWAAEEREHDALWVQTAADPLTFEDRAGWPEWSLDDDLDGRSVVLADLNRDGWLDVVKGNVNQPASTRLSRCGAASWVVVALDGPAPNRRGIGASVVVEAAGRRQVRWIGAGSTGMYTGGPPEAHFGLGSAEVVDALEVRWPDGAVDRFDDVPVRRRLTVVRSR